MAPARPSPDLVERFRRDLHALTGPTPGRIGVAVSGGGDSLALLLLAAAAHPGAVTAATVDHRLRPASAAEADFSASICAGLGIGHRTLAVSVAGTGSLQARARDARYAALAAWAREESVAVLLTAHHGDDQAETLMMRLLRGSGVGGLSGIRAAFPLTATTLLCRPLLGWRQSELAELVRIAGIEPVEDPSNRDERFDRARIRRQLAEAAWIDPLALGRSAAALAEADAALEAMVETLFAERVAIGAGGAMLRPEGLQPILLRRLVTRILAAVAPGPPPRGDQLGALLEQLRCGATVTLAGALCSGGETWRFEPEPRRRASTR